MLERLIGVDVSLHAARPRLGRGGRMGRSRGHDLVVTPATHASGGRIAVHDQRDIA